MRKYERITNETETSREVKGVNCKYCGNAACDFYGKGHEKNMCCVHLFNRLKELEDKIESGEFIPSKVKIGDTVYFVTGEMKVASRVLKTIGDVLRATADLLEEGNCFTQPSAAMNRIEQIKNPYKHIADDDCDFCSGLQGW